MLQASFEKYTLKFKRPSGTSRGVLKTKDSYIIKLWDSSDPETFGLGECGLLKGLSCDNWDSYELTLHDMCDNIELYTKDIHENLKGYPSIRFGLEMAVADLNSGARGVFYDTPFTNGKEGIPINGLIWMGDDIFMQEQIDAKINDGYSCIKMKIGAISFVEEYRILKKLRERYSIDDLEIRVDANGAFTSREALVRLDELSKLKLHSIEQPIAQGQTKEMQRLCAAAPLPIALDEELIGVHELSEKAELLKYIKPQFIILKPSLLGGFKASDEWVDLANKHKIPWWGTSALESNIGLNAIAQWIASKNPTMYQGLGTGQLYKNNIESDLEIRNASLWKSGE